MSPILSQRLSHAPSTHECIRFELILRSLPKANGTRHLDAPIYKFQRIVRRRNSAASSEAHAAHDTTRLGAHSNSNVRIFEPRVRFLNLTVPRQQKVSNASAKFTFLTSWCLCQPCFCKI